MKLKFTFIALLAVTMLASFTSVNKEIESPVKGNLTASKKILNGTYVTNIMAGQYMVAGTVTAITDETAGTLTVTYTTTGNWTLKGVHLYVGTTEGIPVGGNGNPRIGLFPYKVTGLPVNTTTYSFTISLANMPADLLTLAAHCTVSGPSNETGWGEGPQINDGGSWAMKFYIEREGR